jgi:hypothetical protein
MYAEGSVVCKPEQRINAEMTRKWLRRGLIAGFFVGRFHSESAARRTILI